MKSITTNWVEYPFLDIAKFILALLVVCSHYISENAVGRINSLIDYASSIYIIAVPFFFVCSGFLMFRKLNGQNDWSKVIKYCKKNLLLYAGWSFVYICFNIATWVRFGTTESDVFHYILTCFTYSTYQTIWYLPATVIGLVFTYLLYSKINLGYTCFVGILFYLIGCLGTSYSFLLSEPLTKLLNVYEYFFVSTRNGLFNGFPFIVCGLLIAKKMKNEEENQHIVKYAFFSLISFICLIAEAFIIKIRYNAINVNTLIFLIPFSYYFVLLCLNITIKSSKTTLCLRKLSTNIFLCQRLFLSAIPTLFPFSIFSTILNGNPYLGLFCIIILTVITSIVLNDLSRRSKFLSHFC